MLANLLQIIEISFFNYSTAKEKEGEKQTEDMP